ncbi:MAG: addiction module protein [Gemmataceae bacterium]
MNTPTSEKLPTDFAKTLEAARGLSGEDRLRLVEAIWDDFTAGDPLPPLTEAQQAELTRRLAAYEADPTNVIPREQIKAEARARSRR